MKSPALTENESAFLDHMTMFGSAGYPVRRLPGRKWLWDEAFNIKGAPVCYKTKRAAVQAVEDYLAILRDRTSGRVDPSPGSVAEVRGLVHAQAGPDGRCTICGEFSQCPIWHERPARAG